MNEIKDILTPKQYEVFINWLKNKPRHAILEGSIRSGKTVLGIIIWQYLISKTTNKLYIMTGQTIGSLKRNVLDELQKFFDIDTHLNINNEFKMYGNKVACFGSDKSDSYKSMHGLTAAGWYANEVVLSHQNSVLEAFARCSDADSRIIWETNPDKNTHYIKTDYINKSGSQFKDGKTNIINYHFKLEDNSYLDTNYIESLKQSIPKGTYYDRMILGLWKANDKAVYSNYKIVSTIPDEKEIDDYCYGLDFGWSNPCALTKIMWVDGDVYIQGLLYESYLKTSELIEKLKVLIFDKDKQIYCDHDLERIQELKDAGFNAMPAEKGQGSVMAGINYCRQFKLKIISSDSNLVYEIENYELKSNSKGEILEEPIKFKDHYLDSFRMGMYSHNRHKIEDVKKAIQINKFIDDFEY
jgi:PBSX family phage terminase large subunit